METLEQAYIKYVEKEEQLENKDYCLINCITRKINFPSTLQKIGVYKDNGAEIINFAINRYYKEIDLLQHNLYIDYINAGGKTGTYPVIKDSIEEKEDKLFFKWIIDENVTEYKGKVKFLIRFSSWNDEGNTFSYHTEVCELNVIRGIDIDTSVYEKYPTLLNVWLQEMNELDSSVKELSKRVDEKILGAESNFNDNATQKVNEAIESINANHDEKLKEFNDNATQKVNEAIESINANHDEKLKEFNDNVIQKAEAFDEKLLNANKEIDNKVNEATKQAQTATEQADLAKREVAKIPDMLNGKLDKFQGEENAGLTLIVDEDGNLKLGSSKDVYTKNEVNYLLADKMDKPYADVEINNDTTLNDCLSGNFKINTISGNTVQNVEENIVPTPARPIPIVSKKTLVGGEYVELRSLKESVNVWDLKPYINSLAPSMKDIVDENNNVTLMGWGLNAITGLINLLKPNTTYSIRATLEMVEKKAGENLTLAGNTIGMLLFRGSSDPLGSVGVWIIDSKNVAHGQSLTLTKTFTTPADLTNCAILWYTERYTDSDNKAFYSTVTFRDITLVESSTAPTSYIAPTTRDYKIVDHTNKKAWIERNIQVINLNDLIFSYGGPNGDSEGVRFYAPVTPQLKNAGEIYSNVFESLSAYNYTKEGIYGGNTQGGKTLSIIVKDSNITAHTQEALLAYINNPDAVAYYALETPVIEEIEYSNSTDDTSEVGSSFQDNTSPSVSVPSKIKGVSEINIKTVGKNMLKNDSWIEGYYLSGANGELLRGDKNITSNYIDIASYSSYTISTNKNLHSMGYGIYDKDKQFLKFLSIGGKNLLVTSNEYEAKYIRVFFNINNTDNATYEMLSSYNPQLELGNTATNYDPYKESSIQYTLAAPLYGGVISKDVITAENRTNKFNKFIFDGSSDEMWSFDGYTLGTTIRFYTIFTGSGAGASEGALKVWCNKFLQKNYDIYDTEYVRVTSSADKGDAYLWVYLRKDRLESLNVAGFRKWLRENPLEVVVETEFPTTEQAPEELVAGLKELRTYSPVTNVFLEEEVNPTINAQYPQDLTLTAKNLKEEMAQLTAVSSALNKQLLTTQSAIIETDINNQIGGIKNEQ